MRKITLPATRRGDTMIEVLFATVVFALVAILTIALMNNGLSSAISSIELTNARNLINAEAESLRFVHNAVATSGTYKNLWGSLVANATEEPYSVDDSTSCEELLEKMSSKYTIFALSTTTSITENTTPLSESSITTSETYPYMDDSTSYSLWTYARHSGDVYGCYVVSCCDSVSSSAPNILDTVIRLTKPSGI